MNKYGVLAQEYWMKADRTRYDEITDPAIFFAELGEQILATVNSLLMQLELNPPANESYLETVGRLNSQRKQAEEIVMTDLVYIPAVASTVDEELELGEMQGPGEERILELLENLEERMEEISTEEYEEESARLQALRDRI